MPTGIIIASRKINEGFAIGRGPEIRLKVMEIRGDEVLIGVDGPAGTSIEL
jgi:carbon storage regulator CsrA